MAVPFLIANETLVAATEKAVTVPAGVRGWDIKYPTDVDLYLATGGTTVFTIPGGSAWYRNPGSLYFRAAATVYFKAAVGGALQIIWYF